MIATEFAGQHFLVNPSAFWAEWRAGWHLLLHPTTYRDPEGQFPSFAFTAEQTLLISVYATGIAALVGLPSGCALGVGRFPGRRALLGIANALMRTPPVVIGVVVVILATWPLHSVGWLRQQGEPRDAFAQTLLALPIVIGLTATAVQRVPAGLLDQARAYGAPGWKRGLLALREARRSLIAAVIVAMGVTITAVGALAVLGGGNVASCPTNAFGAANPATCHRSDSLATSALLSLTFQPSAPGTTPYQTIAFAYSELLIGLFFVGAAGLTFLQQNRTSWIAAARS